MTEDAVFVIITGNEWSLRDRSANEYVSGIVYGSPKVTAVKTNGHFVALCEWPKEQFTNARYTMERMGSFSYGATLTCDKLIALREFGTWVYHFSLTFDTSILEEVG